MESAKKVLIWEKKVDHYKTSSFLSHIKNELNVTMFGDIEIKKKQISLFQIPNQHSKCRYR